MKKLIAVLLAGVLLVSLVACGSEKPTLSTTPTTQAATEPATEAATEPAATEPAQTEPAETEPAQTEPVATQPQAPEAGTFDNTVLVDEAGVKITATAIDTEALFGPEIKVLVENNSGKDLTFSTGCIAVNGCMVSGLFVVDVVDGKKANESITLMSSDLEKYGIEVIADLSISFEIYETETYEDYLITEQLRFSTMEGGYKQSVDVSEYEVLYDANGFRIVAIDLVNDDFLGEVVRIYMENNTDKLVEFDVEDTSVNGFMVNGTLITEVLPGTCALDYILFFDTEFQENNIETIENLELKFTIMDAETWDTLAESDAFVLTFE